MIVKQNNMHKLQSTAVVLLLVENKIFRNCCITAVYCRQRQPPVIPYLVDY